MDLITYLYCYNPTKTACSKCLSGTHAHKESFSCEKAYGKNNENMFSIAFIEYTLFRAS